MAKKKETKRFLFTKIGQMSLVESRDRHCDGDLKTVKFPLKLFNFKNQSTTVLLYTLMKHD